jgi:gamma-glutamyltranspeptidase / glutathione hydrolase
VTPSGAWVPAVVAGRTGISMSQRAQSFVLEEAENPFNVIAPGKRPRATLTPGLALKDGLPFLSFAVQGGDTQDQNLLQFFLNIVEFGMNVQQACEAANIASYQLRDSFGDHKIAPGKLDLNIKVPEWVQAELENMGYKITLRRSTSGPINAVFFDRKHGTFWGGSSNNGDDYGIVW